MLKAPFPWFGGKSRVAHLVWERFGNVPNYVEPFAGSLAVLLGRPHAAQVETVNDKDYFLANFWRAIESNPYAVAKMADWPVNETDLHARHLWLVEHGAELKENIYNDPFYYHTMIAGWWVWGICQWIGDGWCEKANWTRTRIGFMVGIHNKRPHLLIQKGINGLNKKPQLSRPGHGIHTNEELGGIYEWFTALQTRIRNVRVCCGDWKRICTPSATTGVGLTGVFLDPPYSADRDGVYNCDDTNIAKDVAQWAIENGNNPLLRIALCGYEGEHQMPDTWVCVPWKTQGGYANKAKGESRGKMNKAKERIWFSPHCLKPTQLLF